MLRIGLEWFSKEKYGLVFTVALIVIIGFAYFGIVSNANIMGASANEISAFSGISLKLAFNDNGEAKIFALTPNNALAKYKASEGNPIPEENSIVLGALEAETMKSEKFFEKPGDTINGLFGIDTLVEGVLEKTGTISDYFHFVSPEEFKEIEGGTNIFAKISGNDVDLFYVYKAGAELPSTLKLKEGELADYEEHDIVGQKYYPMIIGYSEAEAMRKEGEFKNLGDRIKDFSQEFIVVGVMEKTGTVIDFAHFVPLESSALIEGA